MRNPVTSIYGINAGIFSNWEEEVRMVVSYAYEMIQKNPDSTVAILVPSAWKIELVIKVLRVDVSLMRN